jgi:hypothetical protein
VAWQMTWANQRWTRGISWLVDVDESSVDTWHASVGCKGATWPNHGLPRGTPVFVNLVLCQKFLESGGFEPGPSPRNAFAMGLRPLDHRMFLLCMASLYLSLVLFFGGGSGRGLAPTPVFLHYM